MIETDLQGKVCLVTGGAGFVGHRLIERLVAVGASVRATLHNAPARVASDQVDYVEADLNQPKDCQSAVQGVDFVFHFAANTQGAAVIRDNPLAHVTYNVPMNTYLLDAAHKAGVRRFLFISSGAAYPDTGHRPAEEHEMFVDEPVDVYYAVAWMKRYAEILCRTYATKIKNPMSCVVVRPSNIYGPGDKFDPSHSHVTAAMIRKVATRMDPLEIWGTGEDVRDLIYIDDFLDGLMRAFATPDAYLAVNLCSGEGIKVIDILKTVARVDGFDAHYQFNPAKPSTVPVRRLSAALAAEKLGCTAQTSLEDGFRETLAWYRANTGA